MDFQEKIRVMHFVTGGFSGATQVAIDLCMAAKHDGFEVLLVLRKKRNTSHQKIQELIQQGLDVRVVSNWLHALTVWELQKIMRNWRPDYFFAHGFSDHIWGRRAAVAEKVPNIFHVEHNSRERYTTMRLKQSLALMPLTRASIGVSEGVRESLIQRGFDAAKCVAIPNGVELSRFPESLMPADFVQRDNAVLMASRFARQKDHATLVQAIGLLQKQGIRIPLYLAGSGKERLQQKIRDTVNGLGLAEQVHFLGNVANLPDRLSRVRIFVLATHWEGMPLALVEAMAAGCACIVSDVIGAREVIVDGETGLLVPESDPQALAYAIHRLSTDVTLAERLSIAARAQALSQYGRDAMWQKYRALLQP